jgi:hypothetical protein
MILLTQPGMRHQTADLELRIMRAHQSVNATRTIAQIL